MNMIDANLDLNPMPIGINNLNMMNNIPTSKVIENINVMNNNPTPKEMNNMNIKNDNPIPMEMEIMPKIISCPTNKINTMKDTAPDYKNNLNMSTNYQVMINSNYFRNSIKSIKKSM